MITMIPPEDLEIVCIEKAYQKVSRNGRLSGKQTSW